MVRFFYGIEIRTPVSENLLYRFLVKSKTTDKETILADYSSNSTTEWIPSVGGDYELIVQAKVEGSSNEYDFSQIYPFTILADTIKVHSVSTNVSSPQEIGTTITLATNATGGIVRQYKYWISDGKEWKVLRDYSSSNTFNWTPTKAGKYRFSVHVKDVNSKKEYDAFKGFEYEIVVGPVKAKSLSVNKPSPQAEGTALTVTANATGGTTKLYKFHSPKRILQNQS